jgi:hypothetical protein
MVTLTSAYPSVQEASIGEVVTKPCISLNVWQVDSPLASKNCTDRPSISSTHVLVIKNSTESVFMPVVSVMMGISLYMQVA